MMTPSNSVAVRRNKEAGQTIILLALALVVLLGFMGFGIDMGILRYEKRIQQTAADAGALAGANDLAWEGASSVTSAAKNATAQNGFTDGSNNVTVTVNNPPASGPHTGQSDYVEVLVSAVHPTYFERIVGINTATVVARAVATDYSGGGSNNSNCLVTLGDPANEIGVDVQGSVTLNATTCGIVDNGYYNSNGQNGLQINACSFSVSGSSTNAVNPTCPGSGPITPDYNAPTAQDPMSNLDNQTPCDLGYSCTGGPNANYSGTSTVPCAGGVCNYSSISINGGNVTFSPGIYIIDGGGTNSNPGLSCAGNPNLSGTGVMFFFTGSATVQCTGDGNMNLTAPNAQNCPSCASEYDGVLMWQDAADPSTGKLNLNGNSCTGGPPTLGPELGGNTGGNGTSSGYNGILYFPADQFWFFGNTHGSVNAINVAAMVSDSMCMTGNADINFIGTSGLGSGAGNTLSTLSNAVLVE